MSRVYGRKRDASHKAIAAALEACGVLVLNVEGAFDILALDASSGLHMIECKSAVKGDGSRKTDTQKDLLRDGWPLEILVTPDDAIRAVGQWRLPRA